LLQAKYVSKESFSHEDLTDELLLASDSQRRARIKNLCVKKDFIAHCVKTADEPNARYMDAVRRPLATVPYTDAARRRADAFAGAMVALTRNVDPSDVAILCPHR